MHCPYCDEPLKPNVIHCENCEQYLPRESIHFTVLVSTRKVRHYIFLSIAFFLVLFAAIIFVLTLLTYVPSLLHVIVLLGIAALIYAFTYPNTYYDCPNCRAEKSILVKEKMIKSQCKYCYEKYEFAVLDDSQTE